MSCQSRLERSLPFPSRPSRLIIASNAAIRREACPGPGKWPLGPEGQRFAPAQGVRPLHSHTNVFRSWASPTRCERKPYVSRRTRKMSENRKPRENRTGHGKQQPKKIRKCVGNGNARNLMCYGSPALLPRCRASRRRPGYPRVSALLGRSGRPPPRNPRPHVPPRA